MADEFIRRIAILSFVLNIFYFIIHTDGLDTRSSNLMDVSNIKIQCIYKIKECHTNILEFNYILKILYSIPNLKESLMYVCTLNPKDFLTAFYRSVLTHQGNCQEMKIENVDN